MTKEELQSAIKAIESQLDSFELDPDDYEDEYDEMLSDTNDVIRIGNLVYDPAWVLKNVDEIAYRCGLLDYIDSLDKENNPKYQELQEELDDLQSQLEDLE